MLTESSPGQGRWLSGCLFQDSQGGLRLNLMAGTQRHTALVRTVNSYNSLTPQAAFHSLRVVPLLLNFFFQLDRY